METVRLPVLKSKDGLRDALNAMDKWKRSGVLVEHAGRYRVVYVGSIRETLDRRGKTLAEVGEGFPVHSAFSAAPRRVDLDDPKRAPHEYEALLDDGGVLYAVVERSGEDALVVTRHENLAQMLSLTSTYYCDGPTKHYFPYPRVQVGDDCLKCFGQPKGKICLKA